MGHAQPTFSLADFLAWEETQPERHEFVRGEVSAMVGALRVHGLVSGNVFATLREQLRGSPCRAFNETMKLQIAEDVLFLIQAWARLQKRIASRPQLASRSTTKPDKAISSERRSPPNRWLSR